MISDPDAMRYGMIGDDLRSLSEKLEKYTGEICWEYLRPHYAHGALVWVDSSLSLTEVGRAFSEDDTEQVSLWRRSGDILLPSDLHAKYWSEAQSRFLALVVSPFVLIQDIPSGEEDAAS